MARSAKRPKRRAADSEGILQQGAQAVSAFVSQNPTLVGGSTAFLIALAFVSANALWYQPHAHTAPLFSTRSFESFVGAPRAAPEPETTIRLERPETPLPAARPQIAAPVPGDKTVLRVQAVLKELGYYQGEVDGLSGPNTAAAISAYQRKMGLAVSGRVDARLLKELGADDITGSIEPAETSGDEAAAAAPEREQQVSLETIQIGLKAFGNSGIEADGKMGAKTRAGIKEFQALFGLPETGEPDIAVYRKMKAEGLVE